MIEKEMNFTHLSHKTSRISPFKTMYIYTFTTITVHIYTIIVAVHIIILLINLTISHPFFLSPFSMCKTNLVSDFSSPHIFFP